MSVTVPVEVEPPVTELGARETDRTPGGVIVSGVVTEAPPEAAAILAFELLSTPDVVTLNVPDDLPAATSIVLGTLANAESLVRVTETPVGPAGSVSVTVPVLVLPPTTDIGENDNVLT